MGFRVNYDEYNATLKTCLLPRCCIVSGTPLWFTTAYKIKATRTATNGAKSTDVYWVSRSQYLMLSLLADNQE